MGAELWRSNSKFKQAEGKIESSLLSSFLTGLIITLGDQKAIFFYLGFFPAFFDLSTFSIFDISIIIVIATVAIGMAKLVYAFLADRASLIFKSSTVIKGINIAAGTVMLGVGIFLVVKA